MKKLSLILFLISASVVAQQKWITRNGEVSFEASVPSFEPVAAKTDAATAILNTENGEFAALVLVQGFRFENALMEEHFNENYAESAQFPKATFKGRFSNWDFDKIGAEGKTFVLNGLLEFHGKTKKIENLMINFRRKGNMVLVSTSFDVNPEEFAIDIPNLIRKKVAQQVTITVNFSLIGRK
ncbi:MAG TPA: YceI family protein [Salinimicrobium sp.]|nr:YceI family protein [Salinimicrobium sp.]